MTTREIEEAFLRRPTPEEVSILRGIARAAGYGSGVGGLHDVANIKPRLDDTIVERR